ncbi:hypothetical protein ACLB2K_014570 [Fragaria x ananassa]
MAKFFFPLIFLTSFITFFSFSSPATDTLAPSDTLRDSQTLVSAGNYYLGIWFKADVDKVVWVDRDNPIIDSSGLLQIRSGNLVLTDHRQELMIVNTGSLSTTTTNTSATLLDTGNLVLKEADTGTTIWQSFDLPTDTFLPGMKLGLFGLNTIQRMFNMLVSWENPKNPARGLFTLTMDVLNFTRLSVWRGDGVKMVIAFRDEQGLRFIFENSTRNMYNFSYESNEYEAYYTFSTSKNYDFMWFVMGSTGNLDEYFMLDGKISSVSHALCEDSAGGNSARCLTSMPAICVNGGEFSEVNGSLPFTFHGSVSNNTEPTECETLCSTNCSCTAFIDEPMCQLYYGSKQDLLNIIADGTGLIHIRNGDQSGSENVLPMDPDEVRAAKKMRLGRQKDQELPFFSFSTIKTATNYFAEANKLGEGGFGPVYKGQLLVEGQEIAVKRLSKMSRQGLDEFKTEVSVICSENVLPMDPDEVRAAKKMRLGRQKDQELPFFSFSTIKTATNYFAEANKLGEGGFGPVYKGQLLVEGQEIAVKRLSKMSRQGLDEFKTEVSVISYPFNFSGYMAPEYAMDGLFSEKSDVFSFGVIVLEIISSKKNISFFQADQSKNLLSKAWNLWKDDNGMELMDSAFHASCSSSEVTRYIQMGLLCVQERAIDRPTMLDVVAMLSNESFALRVPKEPAFLSQSSSTGGNSLQSRQTDLSKNDVTISEEHGR